MAAAHAMTEMIFMVNGTVLINYTDVLMKHNVYWTSSVKGKDRITDRSCCLLQQAFEVMAAMQFLLCVLITYSLDTLTQ